MRPSARQSEMQRATDAYRARVLAMEQQATLILSATYQDALNTLEPRIVALSKQIEEARANGEEPGISWLFQQERYQELRRQLLTLIDQYGQVTKVVTAEAQKLAMREGLTFAGNVLLPVSGGDGSELATLARGWASVPDSSVIELVGAMQADTPLDETIQSYGVDAVQDVQRALTRGLALGDSVDMTANVLQSLGITRARAESLVRTETLRASRTATIAAYAASGVVRGWRWSCARDARCCPACLAMDGRVFRLEEPRKFHVNCRCSCSPVLKNEPDKPEYQTGADWLVEQSTKVQEQVLGRTAAADYRSGNLQLADFVKEQHSAKWGNSYVNGGLTYARKQATKAGRAPDQWAESPTRIVVKRKVKKATKPATTAPKTTTPTQRVTRQQVLDNLRVGQPRRGLEGEPFVEFLLDV